MYYLMEEACTIWLICSLPLWMKFLLYSRLITCTTYENHHDLSVNKSHLRAQSNFFHQEKNAYALKTPHFVYVELYSSVASLAAASMTSSFIGYWQSKNVFWPCDLDIWHLTLTFELNLDILPLDLHVEIQVRLYVCLAVRVVTHRLFTNFRHLWLNN